MSSIMLTGPSSSLVRYNPCCRAHGLQRATMSAFRWACLVSARTNRLRLVLQESFLYVTSHAYRTFEAMRDTGKRPSSFLNVGMRTGGCLPEDRSSSMQLWRQKRCSNPLRCACICNGNQEQLVTIGMPSQATTDAKFADYAPKLAFFFPGQGAQTVGMAKV